MKTIRKTISLLLALLMLSSTVLGVSFSAFAGDGKFYTYKKDGYYYYYQIVNKEVFVQEAYAVEEENPTATMSIPAKIKGYPVTTVSSISVEKAKKIVFPNSVISIGTEDYGYSWIWSVKTISLGSGVASIKDGFFNGAGNLTAFTVNKKNNFYAAKDGVLYDKAQTKLIQYPMGKSDKSFTTPSTVETIATGAFTSYSEESKLQTVTLSDSVKTLEPNAFRETNIETINIGSGLKKYKGDAISDTTMLKKITVSKDNAYFASWKDVLYSKDYTKIYKYPAKKSGSSYEIWKDVTAIGEGAFAYASLKSVTIPKGVKTIGNGAFYACTKLATATVPATVKSIGDWSFRETGLKSVTLPKSVTALGYGAYQTCSNLSKVDLSKTKLKKIKQGTFSFSNLTSVKLPSTLTSIENEAFYYNPKLKSVTIPASVTKIKGYAFGDNDALKTVTIKGKKVSINANAFPYNYQYNSKTDKYKKVYQFTIKAPKGSTAETFAKKRGIKFVELS